MSRAAFKLLEIQEKHKLIPPGGEGAAPCSPLTPSTSAQLALLHAPPHTHLSAGKVLDLGCHPGAWLQVACKALGPPKNGGMVFGVDIQVPLPVLARRACTLALPLTAAACSGAGDQEAGQVL